MENNIKKKDLEKIANDTRELVIKKFTIAIRERLQNFSLEDINEIEKMKINMDYISEDESNMYIDRLLKDMSKVLEEEIRNAKMRIQ